MLTNLKEKISIFLKSKSNWFVISLDVLLLGIFFFLMTFNNVYTKTYDIERINRAKETIRSPITIENEQETERKTRKTSQAVQDRYDISTEITDERIKYVEEIFEALDKMEDEIDRKSTRLNSSHVAISYAVFCLKK